MTTWAQVVNNTARNVLIGADLSELIAPGFDGGYPGIPWEVVPDGTLSGATTVDGVNFVNPPIILPTLVPLPLTKAQFQALWIISGGTYTEAMAAWPVG